MKKNKAVLYIIVFILVVLAGYLVYSNRGKFQMVGDNSPVYTIDTATSPQFTKQGGGLLVLTRDGLSRYNLGGGQEFSVPKVLSTPAMHNAGNYTVIYDREGKDIITYKNGSKAMEYTCDQSIKFAKINAAGYTAVITDDAGYNEKVLVLNQRGEEVYKWQLSDSYILDIDISPNCKHIAASTVSSESESADGNILLIDIDKEETTSKVTRANSIFPSVKYIKNSYIAAVGESEMLGIDGKGEVKWAVDYNDRILESFVINDSGNPVLCMSGTQNNNILEMYNNKGVKTGEYESQDKIKSLDCLGGNIAVCEKRNVLLLGYNGKVKSKKETQKDIRQVILVKGRSAAVVSAGTVDLAKL